MIVSIRNSRLVTVGLAALIAVGVLGVGSVAFAQEGAEPEPPTSGTERGGHPAHVFAGPGFLPRLAGLTAEDIRLGKEAGLTWGEIIDQYGDISAAEAKAQALQKVEALLARAVEKGRITQERADEKLANLSERVDEFLASKPGDNRHPAVRKVAHFTLDTVADVLGTDVPTIVEGLRDGQTIAEIAGDQAQAVIDALVTEGSAKIDEAVTAGKLDAEKAAEMKANLPEMAERFVNAERPGQKFGQRFHGRVTGGTADEPLVVPLRY